MRSIAKDHAPVAEDTPHLRGRWIWGKSGVGKSRMARDKYGEGKTIFPKHRNKWFDGYQGE